MTKIYAGPSYVMFSNLELTPSAMGRRKDFQEIYRFRILLQQLQWRLTGAEVGR